MRKKSEPVLRNKIREKTRRTHNGSLEEIVQDLNPGGEAGSGTSSTRPTLG